MRGVGPTPLAADGLGLSLGGVRILEGVSLELVPGQVHVLVGPNGAGKTSLLRLLAGLVAPTEGQVRVGGVPMGGLSTLERARRVGVHLEAPEAVFGFDVEALVAMGRYPHRLGRPLQADDVAAVEAALDAMGLGGLRGRSYLHLSAGQRQRVALARLLAQGPAVMLFDEPLARLDPFHVEETLGVLRGLAQAGHTVVAVIHALDAAARVADRLSVIAGGGLRATGAPYEVLSPALVEEVWGVEVVAVETSSGPRLLTVGGAG